MIDHVQRNKDLFARAQVEARETCVIIPYSFYEYLCSRLVIDAGLKLGDAMRKIAEWMEEAEKPS